jgi:hypothetical protein
MPWAIWCAGDQVEQPELAGPGYQRVRVGEQHDAERTQISRSG